MGKVKPGDDVRITRNEYGHEFQIGEVVTLVRQTFGTWHAANDFEVWGLARGEFEVIDDEK